MRGRSIVGVVAGLAALLAFVAGCATPPEKPLPPRITLESVRVSRLTAADARFTLGLAVQNPNAYDLTVNALDLSLAVEGEPFLNGALAAPALLASGGETRVDIDARTSLPAVVAVLDKVARIPKVRYEVTGTAIVNDSLPLPFRWAGELPALDFAAPRR